MYNENQIKQLIKLLSVIYPRGIEGKEPLQAALLATEATKQQLIEAIDGGLLDRLVDEMDEI